MPGDRRRTYGSGTIRQRSDGRWEARGTLPDGRRVSGYGATRKAAWAALEAKRTAAVTTGVVPDARVTLGGFLTDWLESTVRQTRSPNTADWYATLSRVHIIPNLGRVKLMDVDVQTVQRFLAGRSRAGLAPKTVAGIRGVLVTALDDAVRWRLIPSNPARLAKGPAQVRTKVTPPTLADVVAILDAVAGTRVETPVALAVYLGWRQSEVLALRWQDIDRVAGVIRLRQTVVREKRPDGYGLVIRPYGKTSGTTRTVPYPGGLTPFLQRQAERITRLRTMAGNRWVDHDLVCPSAVGRPMDGRNVTRHFQEVLHAAGLRRWAFHDLRHAAASLLIAVETPIEQVQEILGHRQLSTTADIYAHLYPGATRAAMDRLSDAISGELGVELGVTGDDPLPIPMLESKNP